MTETTTPATETPFKFGLAVLLTKTRGAWLIEAFETFDTPKAPMFPRVVHTTRAAKLDVAVRVAEHLAQQQGWKKATAAEQVDAPNPRSKVYRLYGTC